MTYESCEAGLAVQLRATALLEDAQVTLGDWKVLNGGPPHAAIIEYEAFRLSRDTSEQTTMMVWTSRINVLARYTDDVAVHNALRDIRDQIILKVLQNPTLGSVCLDSLPVRGGKTEPDEVVIGNVTFLKEFIDVDIEEIINA